MDTIDNTSLSVELIKEFHKYATSRRIDPMLYNHQRLVADYMTRKAVKGLLAFHGVGTGKTITAIAVAERLNRDTVIICNKSVKEGFITDWAKFTGADTSKSMSYIEHTMMDRYRFATINASNKYDQVFRACYELNDGFISGKSIFDNKLVIIDEAHKFTSMVSNRSKDGRKLYDDLISCKTVKILLLSATPITSDPYQVVIMANLISPSGHRLLPESYSRFEQLFVNKRTGSIKNVDVLEDRLFGLISYFPGSKRSANRPKNLGTKVVQLFMSPIQWSEYRSVRSKEVKRMMVRKSRKHDDFGIPKSAADYAIESRIVSNCAVPTVLFQSGRLKSAYKALDESMFSTNATDKLSPKFEAILHRIERHTNWKHMVYSNFLHQGGLDQLKLFLMARGWIEWDPKGSNGSNEAKYDYKRFVIWSGEQSDSDRHRISTAFNDPNNARGSNIRLILVTTSGAEGINLFCLREIHILEPHWTMARLQQVSGRGNRINSHKDLPKRDRTIESFIYVASIPNGKELEITDTKSETISIDEQLLIISEHKRRMIDEVEDIMKRVAIDCPTFNGKNCVVCAPTNKRINGSLNERIVHGSKCFRAIKLTSKQLKSAKQIKPQIYEWNGKTIVQLDPSLNYFIEIYDK